MEGIDQLRAKQTKRGLNRQFFEDWLLFFIGNPFYKMRSLFFTDVNFVSIRDV
jgi:hypothetical protein